MAIAGIPIPVISTLILKFMPKGIVNQIDSAENPLNTDNPGVTGPVALAMDAIINENPNWTATPTENPLENGSTVTDHIRVLPKKVTFDCVITGSAPLFPRSGILEASSNPVLDALDFLDTAFSDAWVFDFVSGLTTYVNYCIVNLSIDRQAKTGNELRFKMTLQQVVIVSSAVTPISQGQLAPDVQSSGATAQNLGNQPGTPATTAQNANVTALNNKFPNNPSKP